ncbi:MAG: hypothetical protein JNK82_01140 [Myxococcaceae bacterium]|nr:hypothetical protein [Myxococcaceae bacterium]
MNYALQKLRPSPQLAVIVGAGPVTRAEALHKVLEYARERGLTQSATIHPDETLSAVLGPGPLPLLEMTKGLEKNLRVH